MRASSWRRRWRRGHQLTMSIGSLFAILLLLSCPLPSLAQQLWVFVPLVVLLGVPHGSLDHDLGQRALQPSWGRKWPVVFTVVYLSIMACVVALWWAHPLTALALFYTVSVFHFGTEDLPAREERVSAAWLEILLRGGLVIVLPLHFHAQEGAQILRWLLPGQSAMITETWLHSMTTWSVKGVLASVVVLVAMYWSEAWILRSKIWFRHGAELIVLCLWMSIAPPLLAFAVYFCGWHSYRHYLHLASELNPHSPKEGWKRLLTRAFPLSALSWTGLALIWVLLLWVQPAIPALVRVVFVGLSVLTFPHILMNWLAYKADNAPTPAGLPSPTA